MKTRSHVPALDGLRGIAVALVVLFHFWRLDPTISPVTFATAVLVRSGWIGVDLFFVLSGYLITGNLLDARGSEHYFRTFYLRRALRIFPLYYAVLAVLGTAAFLWSTPAALLWLDADYPWYFVYGSNWLGYFGVIHHAPFSVGHFWSLAVEEQFYLAWPVLIAAVPPRRLHRSLMLIVAGSLALRVALVLTSTYPPAAYVLTPARLDGLTVGAAVALACRSAAGRAVLERWSGPIGLGAALGTLALLAILSDPWLAYLNPAVEILSPLLLAGVFGAVIAMIALGRAHRPISRAPLRFLGRYSYGIYVLHLPLRPYLDAAIPVSGWCSQAAYYAVGIGLSIGLALLSWRYVESPFLRLKDRVPYARPAREPA